MKQHLLVSACCVLAVTAACLSEHSPSGSPPPPVGAVSVETGYTDSSFFSPPPVVPPDPVPFTLSWQPVEGASSYEVRVYPMPMSASNWDDAVVVASLPAGSPTDAVPVFVQPEVFENTCVGCGLCEAACPHDAITVSASGKAVIDPALCTQCGECFRTCPFDAISDNSYGQPYYFGVCAVSPGGAYSDPVCTSSRYYMRYTNWEQYCGDCAEACYILLDSCGPGCPVDAVWFEDSTGEHPGRVHIDHDLCVQCGQCMIQCHQYGLLTIRREVVEEGPEP
ncbi:4Fe-4S binding protein [Candidatus Fermentibacterales bacterium]|nr:4Fe-4S binding protein [Candidatus Fermentibacterales bacterium]